MILVTIAVISYNSSKYIIETLNSIKTQTYLNLELIISDDCSTDTTMELCEHWLKKNRERFTRVELLKTDKNGGICYNYNHALKAAKGKWIKYIAGDDKLKSDCIESLIKYAESHKDQIIISKEQHFSDHKANLGVFPRDFSPWTKIFPSNNQRIKYQELYLAKNGTVIPGPTLFLNRETLLRLKGFEEKYPFIEDYPLAMKYLSNGFAIGGVDKVLIDYRVYPDSVSRSDIRFERSIYSAIDYYNYKVGRKHKSIPILYHTWLDSILRKRQLYAIGYILRLFDLIYIKKKINSSKFIRLR